MINYKWIDVGNNQTIFYNDKYVGTITRQEDETGKHMGWSFFSYKTQNEALLFKKMSQCEDFAESIIMKKEVNNGTLSS